MSKTVRGLNSVDTKRFVPSNNDTVDNHLHVLWIGRTSGAAAKGARALSNAIKIIKKKKIPIEAKFIGYATGISARSTEAYGWVHDPVPYLQWSHVVFGRGRALREAMSCGNVGFLIGEGYGGIVKPDWFKDGKQPLLSASLKHGYSKLDISTIVNDLLYFHYHRSALKKARKTAREICVKNFNIDIMVEKTYSVYKKAIIH